MTRRACRFLGGGLALPDAAVPALALLKFEQSLKQPRAAEIRPERFGDKNLRVGDLPKQKIAHAHLAAGAEQQVGVRQAFGVQVPRELLRGDLVGSPVAVAVGTNGVAVITDLRLPS